MNNQLESDHYIYALYDNFNTIRYIGMGRGDRFKDKSKRDRSSKFLEILNNGGFIKLLHSGLNRYEAIELENKYLKDNLGKASNEFNLINKAGPRKIRNIKYEVIDYYFEASSSSPTGLIWKIDKGPKKKGSVAGTLTTEYITVMLEGICYLAHRLLWVLQNKKDLNSDFVINHKDSDKRNNSSDNLELVTYSENNGKINRKPNTSTGIAGVAIIANGKKVKACISVNSKKVEKTFSIKKYGYDTALRLAIEWRESINNDRYFNQERKHNV